SPPDFPELLNDGAYFRMKLTGDKPLESGAQVVWLTGERPAFVLKLPGKEAGYLTLAPGQSAPLPVREKEGGGRAPWIESFRQGFLHVLPLGLDHVLFVMGLFFYHRAWRPLLSQSLTFTLAHTLTLGLAAIGWVRIPGGWVEPMIALSLVVIALENLRARKKDAGPARLAIVFGFGLVHGLGFAGALSVWLRPGDGFLTALLCANLGVEAAQAALLATAWCLTFRWHESPSYRRARWAGCLAIAGIGAFWCLQRLG
ncbi:MAG TPA: HupE/UreJ family protein, partial [Luteolibacter sp.]